MTELLGPGATSQTRPPMLTVTFEDRGSVCVLTLSGQLTRTSVVALDAQVDQIGCSDCAQLILDVAQLTDLDAVGSRALAGLDIYVRALGARLTVNGANGEEAKALGRTLQVVDDDSSAASSRAPVGYACHFSALRGMSSFPLQSFSP